MTLLEPNLVQLSPLHVLSQQEAPFAADNKVENRTAEDAKKVDNQMRADDRNRDVA